ncbi:hypothetical protein CPB86DRAFT_878488 [Serendipita vermifera]|nr:hypothetical protein CPB86DRAFT_878488 [Serendipita vermifera]
MRNRPLFPPIFMLLLVVLYHLASTMVLPFADVPVDIVSPRSTQACNDIDDCRKLNDVIWSCLTTIFACTWLTQHPNIPPIVDHRDIGFSRKYLLRIRRFLRHQIVPFLVVLTAPEWVLAWALQQRLVANQIVKEGGQGWTRTHGFFVTMGGFHAFTRENKEKPRVTCDSDTPWYPLHRREVMELFKKGDIELPLEAEIQDKSKTDWLAKALVILQTGWFVVQCIARGVAHLPLSELEIVTLAYTTMNVGIYAAWWDKPRNVDRPIRVYIPRDIAEEMKSQGVQRREQKDIWQYIFTNIIKSIMPGSTVKDDENLAGYTGVPTFYMGSPTDSSDTTGPVVVSSAVGTVFGAIHCIAWPYPFPSQAERILWRLSSMAIIGVPALVFIGIKVFGLILDELPETRWWSLVKKAIQEFIYFFLGIFVFLGPLLYVVSRVITFVLAFKTLGSLPSNAFYTIPWTKWIPHI